MYLVRSLRTFIGTNAERIAAGLESFLPGDEYIETDTSLVYIHNGMAWLLNSSAGSPGGSDTQIQFNDDGVFGGASSLIYDKILGDFRILGDGNSHLFMLDYSTNSIGFGTNGAFGTIALFSPSIIVYNEDGQDVDFRVESSNFSNIFKVDAGLDAVQIGTAAAGTIADFSSAGIVFNEEGENRDFRVEGDTATNLLVTDAGLDAVRIGTTIAGALLDVAPTGIIFNNAEADVDLRIAGNGITNGYFYDAGLNRHGYGTNAPSFPVHVLAAEDNVMRLHRANSGNIVFFDFYHPNTTDGNNAIWRFTTDTTGAGASSDVTFGNIFCSYDTHDHATRTGRLFLRTVQNGSLATRIVVGGNAIGGVSIGTGSPATSAMLEISGTTGALLLPRLTTTQRNALTAVNGMIIYNSTNNVIEGYENGSWVNL